VPGASITGRDEPRCMNGEMYAGRSAATSYVRLSVLEAVDASLIIRMDASADTNLISSREVRNMGNMDRAGKKTLEPSRHLF
jgi:hypothetical protein